MTDSLLKVEFTSYAINIQDKNEISETIVPTSKIKNLTNVAGLGCRRPEMSWICFFAEN